MPHLAIQHTPNLKADTSRLCRALLDVLATIRDAEGRRVYPAGGTRVMAFPAAHYSVGDGNPDHAFVYLNLRIIEGRSRAVVKETGERLLAAARVQLEAALAVQAMGISLNIEETPRQQPGPVVLAFEAFHNTLRPLLDPLRS